MNLVRLFRRSSASELARRRDARLRRSFDRERRVGMRLGVGARLAALTVIGIWIVLVQRDIAVAYYLAILVIFMTTAVVQLALAEGRRDRPWHKFAFVLFDAVLLTAALVVPNPMGNSALPPAFALRWENFLYFFLFLALTVLSLSPWYVLWTGFVLAGAWSVGVLWILKQPQTTTLTGPGDTSQTSRLIGLLDPNYVDLVGYYHQVLLLLVVTAVLALAVHRSRSLVRRQAAAERERGNLARYFSPNVVDALADLDDPLGRVRQQNVAVLFADIVGFSSYAEQAPPEEVIALLRRHYERLGDIVFAQGGTLDKYIGDALMAVFGTPRPAPDDAARALRCALAMLQSVEEWNEERAASGAPPVRIGIGLDYGPVVLGNIGNERRLEITVIGDAVNVASRLQEITRTQGSDLAVSDRLVAAAREGGAAAEVARLSEGPLVALRGRVELVRIWTLGERSIAAAASPLSGNAA